MQPLDDVGAHGGSGRGGQRQHDRVAEGVDDVAEAAVVGPEVVAPLAHAVGLVDDEQRRLGADQGLEGVLAGELLGGQEHELEVARPQAANACAGGVADRRVDLDRRAHVLALEADDLVALQGDERGHHHGGPGSGGGDHLVDGRLAVAGRHDGQHVPPPDRGVGRRALAGAQAVERQLPPGDPVEPALRGPTGPRPSIPFVPARSRCPTSPCASPSPFPGSAARAIPRRREPHPCDLAPSQHWSSPVPSPPTGPGGGTGRRGGLKPLRPQGRAGSIPAPGTCSERPRRSAPSRRSCSTGSRRRPRRTERRRPDLGTVSQNS